MMTPLHKPLAIVPTLLMRHNSLAAPRVGIASAVAHPLHAIGDGSSPQSRLFLFLAVEMMPASLCSARLVRNAFE